MPYDNDFRKVTIKNSLVPLPLYDLLAKPKNKDHVLCLSSLASRLLSEFLQVSGPLHKEILGSLRYGITHHLDLFLYCIRF